MKGWFLILFKCLVSVFLTATLFNCTPTYKAHKTYPNFYKQHQEFDSVKLAVDAIIFESRRNRPIDYDRQVLVAKEFHNEFIKRAALDFRVDIDTSFYGSSGLYLYPGTAAYVVDALDNEGEVIDSTMIIAAPFFISGSLESDIFFKEELLLNPVDTLAWDVEVEEPYFPTDVVIICLIEGMNRFQASYLGGMVYIFDRETGKLIWKDEQYSTSSLANGVPARELARKFVERFSRVNPKRP